MLAILNIFANYLYMRFLLNMIYPPRCPFCDVFREDSKICPNCLESMVFLKSDFNDPRLEKLWFHRAKSVFTYEGVSREAIHGFKYSLRFDLLPVFTELLFDRVSDMGSYDFIIPVPLHWRRLFMRGYNQSSLLAKALAKKMSISTYLSLLKRVRFNLSQVSVGREERFKNMRGSFDINRNKRAYLDGKAILLIDDVITTGATVNECAKVLVKKGGCGKVDVLTLARTLMG